jgi:uncharacterized protein YPO0396
MTTTDGRASLAGAPTAAGQLRDEIQHTRAELAETVEALAAKADVKARAQNAARDMVSQARHAVRDAADRAGHAVTEPRVGWILIAIGALAVLAAAGTVLVRRRR